MNINIVAVTGRLGRDPQVMKTRDGKSVCNFSLAVKKRGSEESEWIPFVAWGKAADIIGQYAKKGDELGVEGCITARNAVRDGLKYVEAKVLVREVYLPSKKKSFSNEAKSADKGMEEFMQAYREVEEEDNIPW